MTDDPSPFRLNVGPSGYLGDEVLTDIDTTNMGEAIVCDLVLTVTDAGGQSVSNSTSVTIT
jgi:hypothetical protein